MFRSDMDSISQPAFYSTKLHRPYSIYMGQAGAIHIAPPNVPGLEVGTLKIKDGRKEFQRFKHLIHFLEVQHSQKDRPTLDIAQQYYSITGQRTVTRGRRERKERGNVVKSL